MKTIERIFNVETGETVDIERDMTADELAQYNAVLERNAKELAEKAEKDAARKAIFDKLGLTEEEAKLLLN